MRHRLAKAALIAAGLGLGGSLIAAHLVAPGLEARIDRRAAAIAGSLTMSGSLNETASMSSHPMRAADLVSRLGVVTHIDYTDSQYAAVGQVVDSLRYLGLMRVRNDGPRPNADPAGQRNLGAAAAAGVQFLFVCGDDSPAGTIARLRSFLAQFPKSIVAIEGPNEVNNFPVRYSGRTGTPAARGYQADLFDRVKADPVLRRLPVLSFTDWPPAAGKADWNNVHVYPKNGEQPFTSLLGAIRMEQDIDPGRGIAFTEGGYHNLLGQSRGRGWAGVSDDVQARLVLNYYLDAAKLGAKAVFLYQLLDAYPDRPHSDQEKHFGLFDIEFRPKPAAIGIRNFVQLLADTSPGAASFAVTPLSFRISQLPDTAHTLLIQKSDGSYLVILWNEPDIWDEASERRIAVPAKQVAVDIAGGFEEASLYRPLRAAVPVESFSRGQKIVLDLSDEPLILKVRRRR
jgi:hypothetical protein